MSNPSTNRSPPLAINSPQAHQQTLAPQHASSHRPSEHVHLTIDVGSNTTETDILNAITMHIFGPEMRHEAQQVSTSRAPSDALPSSSRSTLNRSIPRTLARLVRPFNRRSSSKLGESGKQGNPNLDGQLEGSHRRFIEDVRNALPGDIDSVVVDSLGQDALSTFSRDTFPYELLSFLQGQGVALRDDLYSALVDLLSAKVRSYTFSEVPIRVIKLPEVVFLERDGLAEHLLNKWLKKEARYIILSHTWEGDELTYKDFFDSGQRTRRSQSYDKLKNFCTIAHKEFGAGFAWADTVCIDKSSSAELDESIRSMFVWYRNSDACLVYLSRSLSLQDLAVDRWFTRGWTLQELLAPLRLKFYNRNWQPLTHLLNDKKALGRRPRPRIPRSYTELAQTILTDINSDTSHLIDADLNAATREEISQLESAVLKATGISMNDIIDFKPGFLDNLSKHMRWIAHRSTTRAEDKSYCLMGILGVSMSTAYGEGAERAFFRLFETILKVSSSPGLFLWAGKPVERNIHTSYMIPSSPECFIHGDLPYPTAEFEWDYQQSLLPPREPITLTNVGLCMSILAIPEVQLCSYEDPGPTSAKVMLLKTALSDDVIKVTLLNDGWIAFHVHEDRSRTVFGEFAFGVCNFAARAEGSRPRVPARFWVILLYRRDAGERWRRLSTRDVITFECAQRFRHKEPEPCHVAREWTGSAVGSSWKLPGTPQMTLQTLYL